MARRTTKTSKKTSSTPARKAAAAAAMSEVVAEDAEDAVGEELQEAAAPGEPADSDARLSRRELVNRVAASTGAKKPVVRQVVDAVLKELGDALSSGAGLNLQPLGKASVRRTRELPNAEVLMLKLRRNRQAPKPDGDEPIAPAAE